MRSPPVFLAAALAVGTTAAASILIGNPQNTETAFDGHGLSIDEADIVSAELVFDDCSANTLAAYGPMSFDLTTSPTVEMPPDTCEARLEHAGTLTVEGADGTATFTLELAVDDLMFTFGTAVPQASTEYIIALTAPGWVTASELGLSPGTHTTVDSSDPIHDTIVGRIEADAAIFIDSNGDGAIDAAERAAGPVAD
ncbi:MAG: hypothetical protein ACI8PZ_002633 [Myxococcota bacterium]|jgi:hypothetical protein